VCAYAMFCSAFTSRLCPRVPPQTAAQALRTQRSAAAASRARRSQRLLQQLLHLADARVQRQVLRRGQRRQQTANALSEAWCVCTHQVLVANLHHQACDDLRLHLRAAVQRVERPAWRRAGAGAFGACLSLQVQRLPLLNQPLNRRLGVRQLLRRQRLRGRSSVSGSLSTLWFLGRSVAAATRSATSLLQPAQQAALCAWPRRSPEATSPGRRLRLQATAVLGLAFTTHLGGGDGGLDLAARRHHQLLELVHNLHRVRQAAVLGQHGCTGQSR
jgi:hypothetical protein